MAPISPSTADSTCNESPPGAPPIGRASRRSSGVEERGLPDHVIGVDIGTTATKAVVFDLGGRVVAHRAVEYPLLTPTPGAAEQDPEQIYRAVIAAIRDAVRGARVAPNGVACV